MTIEGYTGLTEEPPLAAVPSATAGALGSASTIDRMHARLTGVVSAALLVGCVPPPSSQPVYVASSTIV